LIMILAPRGCETIVTARVLLLDQVLLWIRSLFAGDSTPPRQVPASRRPTTPVTAQYRDTRFIGTVLRGRLKKAQ
jgi:hypothetical protein